MSAGRAFLRLLERGVGSAMCAVANWRPWRRSMGMVKKPNSRRNLDMAIRRAFGDDRFVLLAPGDFSHK